MDWTPENRVSTIVALHAIGDAFSKGGTVPLDVYEALAPCFKKISTEFVLFGRGESVWLATRPENSDDPYSGQAHFPGVTHRARETEEAAWQRLVRSELGPHVHLDGPHFIDMKESLEPQRGLYQMRIHGARLLDSEMRGIGKGAFYWLDDLPLDKMVTSHVSIVLPTALPFARKCGWIK